MTRRSVCSEWRASVCTKERRECGTVEESHLVMCTNLVPRFGKEGIKVLGTPIGSAQFTWERLQTRIVDEQRLWDAIPRVPICSVVGSSFSKAPQSAHCHLSSPASMLLHMTRACGGQRWHCWARLQAQQTNSREQIASLPMRMGGLGLHSAGRCAAAAYWASWADARHMICQRNPPIVTLVVETLSGAEVPQEGCLAQVHECAERLDRNSRTVRDPQSQWMVNQGSGNTGGNIGLLPFPTRMSGT